MTKQLIVRQGLVLMMAALLAGGAGWYAHKWYLLRVEKQGGRRVVSKGYEFTSPLLDVELPEGINIDNEPYPFKHKIDAFVEKHTDGRRVKIISVYYRDLLDGPWFKINGKTEYNPASMMKVPVMIAWLKRAERDPGLLERKMKYDEVQNPVPEQYTKPARSLVSGQSYTVDELLKYMMNYSDNKATSLLFNALSAQELAYVLDNMDINNNPNEEGNSLTVHGYSGFFRILYNAAYLSRDMSEKALRLLSLQDFPLGGIAAGVPKGIRVAAKFGEFVPENRNNDIQLHEFGIVYHPKGHYILGIMTRGHDFAAQADIIREISKIIYSEVDASIRN